MLITDGNDARPEPDAIMNLLRSRVALAQEDRQLIAGDLNFLTDHLISSIIVGPTTLAMFGFEPLSSMHERQSYLDKAWALLLGCAGSRSVDQEP